MHGVTAHIRVHHLRLMGEQTAVSSRVAISHSQPGEIVGFASPATFGVPAITRVPTLKQLTICFQKVITDMDEGASRGHFGPFEMD